MGFVVLLKISFAVCSTNWWILGKFCILLFHEVIKKCISVPMNIVGNMQVSREPLVCVGDPIQSYSNGGKPGPERRLG